MKDIELADLHDPEPQDDLDSDDADIALLGVQRLHVSRWRQVSSIVLEVCVRSQCIPRVNHTS
jgi:hypothetical protein